MLLDPKRSDVSIKALNGLISDMQGNIDSLNEVINADEDGGISINGKKVRGAVDITSEIKLTRSSGHGTLSIVKATRWGCLVQILFSARSTASTSAGTNFWSGTISGLTPLQNCHGTGYFASTNIGIYLTTSNSLTLRVLSSSLASGKTAQCSIMCIDATKSALALYGGDSSTPYVPTTYDYETLINKPTLNGVEIIGDKTSEDYGISGGGGGTTKTKLSEFADDLGSSPVHTHSQYLTEHQSLDGKQDVISDLDTIRSGASKGATALQKERIIVLTESNCTVEKSTEYGVAPYSTSYRYTNVTVNGMSESDLAEGLLIMPVCAGTLIVASGYRNVRIRFGENGNWHPLFGTTSILAGSSYWTATVYRLYQYRTNTRSEGAFHVLTDSNSTYSTYSLGIGYGTCTTAESTVAKVVTHASYTLVNGGINAVKFTNGVCASATLNVNSKGAKPIYYKGSAITSGIIKAGEIATFVYTTTPISTGCYELLAINRDFDKTYLTEHQHLKTINNQSIIGDGNITISGGGGGGTVPTNLSEFVDDLGSSPVHTHSQYLTSETDPTVPSWAKASSKPTYTASEVGALPSDTPLFSGNYNDLTNKPTIPSLSGYATESWVEGKGYLTEHQTLKTINSESLVGTGNIDITSGSKVAVLKTWTDTTFAAQTVSVSELANYDLAVVVIGENDNTLHSCTVPITSAGSLGAVSSFYNLTNTSQVYFLKRSFVVNTSSIEFKACYYKAGNAMTTSKTNNAYLVPRALYGIKL